MLLCYSEYSYMVWSTRDHRKGIKQSKTVKCTLVQALRLCTGCMAHRGSRGIALLFLDHGTRRGEGSASCPEMRVNG